jgi:hypothetical protein
MPQHAVAKGIGQRLLARTQFASGFKGASITSGRVSAT